MDVHELNKAFQDLLDASASSDAQLFDQAWVVLSELITDGELLDNPGLLAEVLLAGEQNICFLLKQSHERHRKLAGKTRKRMFEWLLALLPNLEAGQLQLYVTSIIQATLHHAKVEENVPDRLAALEVLSLLLSWMTEGRISPQLLPEPPLAVAEPLQRLYMSSEARKSITLRAGLLGVLGLLLHISSISSTAGGVTGTQPSLGRISSGSSGSRLEPLTRHWLLAMCRDTLKGDDGKLSREKANEGSLEGMTAALTLMEPGEADLDLSAMLHLTASVLRELATSQQAGQKPPGKYNKYKAALGFLRKLGPKLTAARLLLRPAGIGSSLGAATGSGAADAVGNVIAVQLLEDLMAVSAASANKEMRAAAEAAMTATASMVCTELLEARSPDGAAVLQSIVDTCSRQLAGAGPAAAAGAGEGSGWMRGAVEVLGKLCPAVAAYQGEQVVASQWQ